MSTAARKARKRAGIKFTKPPKVPTRRHEDRKPVSLGLVSRNEILSSILLMRGGW